MSDRLAPAERRFAIVVGLALALAVVSPALRPSPRDSFPLSTYPMFSRGRPDTDLSLVQALGVRPDGARFPLPPRITADTYEVLQSMVVLDRAVREGRAGGLCEAIAARARAAASEDVAAVEIATSRFDVVRYFEEAPRPLARVVHARCEVER
jgi:hypothetical protein